MTTTDRRRTVRLSTAYVRNRGRAKAVVVILQPPGDAIEMRLKGERKTYRLPLAVVYTMAVNAHVQAEKSRRKAERKARRR